MMFGLFGKNDWKPIWTRSSYWNGGVGHIPVSYEILYSLSRDELKLKCYGHKPKLHPMYSEAVRELNERNDK